MQRWKMYIISKKEPSPNSWTIVSLSGMNSFHLLIIAITYFPAAKAPNLHSSLYLDEIQQKDAYLTIQTTIGIMTPLKEK